MKPSALKFMNASVARELEQRERLCLHYGQFDLIV
jgi:hypothetical protein